MATQFEPKARPGPQTDYTTPPEPAQPFLQRTLAAFTYRDFRVLWFGAFTSTVGTWMQKVAQSWLVFDLTKNPFFLGLDDFLGQLPILLLHARRRRRRRSSRSAAPAPRLAVRTDDHGVHAGGARLLRPRPHLAHPGAVVRDRNGAGVRRPSVPIADSIARAQEAPDECDRAELDPVQPRARVRTAPRRRGAVLRHGRMLRFERPVLPRRDRRVDVAAHQTYPSGRPEADAAGDERRHRVRAEPAVRSSR